MFDFVSRLFDTNDFPRRWDCGHWTPGHGWLHILSDLGVWSAYIAIPCVLVYFAIRKKNIPFRSVFLLFGAFILACGTTHLLEALLFWWPAYRLAGAVKLLTACVSWATVLALVPITPRALSMRTPDELEKEILARIRAEEALRAANAELELRIRERTAAVETASKLAAIVESSQDAIVGWTLDGTVTNWNQGAERIYGYSAAEAVGRAASFLYPPDRAAEMDSLLEHARRGERVVPFETRRLRKDGREVDVLVSISPIVDGSGRVVGLASIAQDVTERKQLEALFQQAQKMEAVGRLAGGIAHDFNNLLTVINGYCDYLLTNPDSARASEAAAEIARAGERASNLTSQLLAYSRKHFQRLSVLDLNEVVAGTHRMLRRLIGEDIEFVRVPGSGLRTVRADPSQLGQVLMNLAVNARDAMPHGGKLTIETRNVDFDEQAARLLGLPPGPYVVLAVADTGCGMDAETQSHLFEPFFTTKPLGRGTGLGLASVYGIVKQSGGHIQVFSEPGRGTTFEIYLPGLEEVGAGARPAGPEKLPGGTETILLVEDEDTVRNFTRLLLQQVGYTVLAASGGEEALELSRRHGRIDLLVTDVVMPRLNGPQVAEALRAERPGLRVLYISGYSDESVFRHGVLESEADFLPKPFTSHALASRVRDLLDRPESGQPEPKR